MKKKGLLLLFTVIIIILCGCLDEWYPIYHDCLYTINIDGSELNYIREDYGSFLLSPDRETLIEQRIDKIYTVDMDDLTSTTLLHDLGDFDFSYPDISNSKIVFVNDKNENNIDEIYTLNLENGDIIRLTNSSHSEIKSAPAFSNDATKIVYSPRIDSLVSIVVMNSDGSNKNVIYETIARFIRFTHFVQNDEKIIYYLSCNQYGVGGGLYSIRTDGSENTMLCTDRPQRITVSPSSDQIIYYYSGNIIKINLESGIHSTLASSSFQFIPVFSPDGEKILYHDTYYFIMNTNGTNNYKLVEKKTHTQLNYKPYFLDNEKILLNLKKQVN